MKLEQQYRGGLDGGNRVADTVGAGSEDFGKDGRKPNGGWEKGANGLRTGGQKSLVELWGKSKASVTLKPSSQEETRASSPQHDALQLGLLSDAVAVDREHDFEPQNRLELPGNQIFHGLCFYINGSTMPLMSDHKLKYLLTQHGASQSITLGRRTVTHVILGTACGGSLSGSKLQKEIAKTRGNTVKFITVEWVLESVKAGKRLPESRFSSVKLTSERQSSVLGFGAGAHRPVVEKPPAG